MGERTAIAWTDHTFNPWHGCTEVSPACDNCYARTFSKRTGRAEWGDLAERVVMSDKYWRHPLSWDADAEAAGRPALVFCASMADVFEDRADLTLHRRRLFALIAETPHLIWQLLTKRPQHVLRMVPILWLQEWPSNVWIGTTVEDQERADERMPEVLRIPARVRFLSCEPLLGRVDLTRWLRLGSIEWVIAGGESGAGHRPLELAHARDLRDQAHQYDIPFFFKQVGGRFPASGGDQLEGQTIKQFPAEALR